MWWWGRGGGGGTGGLNPSLPIPFTSGSCPFLYWFPPFCAISTAKYYVMLWHFSQFLLVPIPGNWEESYLGNRTSRPPVSHTPPAPYSPRPPPPCCPPQIGCTQKKTTFQLIQDAWVLLVGTFQEQCFNHSIWHLFWEYCKMPVIYWAINKFASRMQIKIE